jgi:hypothetical protein
MTSGIIAIGRGLQSEIDPRNPHAGRREHGARVGMSETGGARRSLERTGIAVRVPCYSVSVQGKHLHRPDRVR